MRAEADPRTPPALNGVLLPRASRLFAASAIAVAALWLPMSLTYPFGWDQGIFAWAGDIIVRGGLPYVDAWDLKGPLVYYVYALAEAIFGAHLWSIRILDALLAGGATLSIAHAATALTDRTTARWTALGFFLWYAAHSFWHTAQPDAWGAMLLIIALAPVLTSGGDARSPRILGLAGFLIGVTTLGKPLYAGFLILPLADAAMADRRGRSLRFVATLAGWLTPIAITVAWFASQHALDDLIEIHLRYAALYAGLSPGGRVRGLVDYVLAGRVFAVALPVCLFGAATLWSHQRRVAILLVSWGVLALLLAVSQNRFYAYHWLPMLPPVTLLTAYGLYTLYARVRAVAVITAIILFVHAIAPVALEEARFAAWLSGQMSTDAYYEAYGEPGDDMKAVRWLRQAPPGSIYVFGWNSGVPWLSGHPTVSRFGFSMPLLIGPGLEARGRYRAELMAALQKDPPRYVLLGTQAEKIIGTDMTLDDVPELAAFVRGDYAERARFGKLVILERTH